MNATIGEGESDHLSREDLVVVCILPLATTAIADDDDIVVSGLPSQALARAPIAAGQLSHGVCLMGCWSVANGPGWISVGRLAAACR